MIAPTGSVRRPPKRPIWRVVAMASLAIFAVVLVAAAGGFIYLRSSLPKTDQEGQTGQSEVAEYFATDYQDARTKFLNAAKAASADIESYGHLLRGPNGSPMAIDVAALGAPDAEIVLVLGAGTHGVEGFAGSAIQVGLLVNDYGSRLPPNIRLVLVHAINPYGFAHLRRANEDNIDLNRNFRDHRQPVPKNPGYVALADAIAPDSISLLSETYALSQLFSYAARQGVGSTRYAITGGQYSHPQGLFFGGQSETWSAKTLRTIVQRYGKNASSLVFIDVHTGLGPYKNAEIILNVPKRSATFQRARSIWGDLTKSTKANESVSADIAGPLKLAIPHMLTGIEVTAASLEFGTVPSLKALRALRAENWLHHHVQGQQRNAKAIKQELLVAFYPQSDDWRSTIWNQGQAIIDQTLARLLIED